MKITNSTQTIKEPKNLLRKVSHLNSYADPDTMMKELKACDPQYTKTQLSIQEIFKAEFAAARATKPEAFRAQYSKTAKAVDNIILSGDGTKIIAERIYELDKFYKENETAYQVLDWYRNRFGYFQDFANYQTRLAEIFQVINPTFVNSHASSSALFIPYRLNSIDFNTVATRPDSKLFESFTPVYKDPSLLTSKANWIDQVIFNNVQEFDNNFCKAMYYYYPDTAYEILTEFWKVRWMIKDWLYLTSTQAHQEVADKIKEDFTLHAKNVAKLLITSEIAYGKNTTNEAIFAQIAKEIENNKWWNGVIHLTSFKDDPEIKYAIERVAEKAEKAAENKIKKKIEDDNKYIVNYHLYGVNNQTIRNLALAEITTKSDTYSKATVAKSWASLANLINAKILDEVMRNMAVEAINMATLAVTSTEEKSRVTLYWNSLLNITDSILRNQALAAVISAPVESKAIVANCWLDYLSKIPDEAMRNLAVAAVTTAPIAEKMPLANAWWLALSKIPDEAMRNLAIEAVKAAPIEDKVSMAARWRVLSTISDEGVRNQAVAAVNMAVESKMAVAKSWVSLSKITDPTIRNQAVEAVNNAVISNKVAVARTKLEEFEAYLVQK